MQRHRPSRRTRSRLPAAAVLACAGLALLVTAALSPDARAQQDDPQPERRVLVTTFSGTIGPVSAVHINDGVGRAERGGYEAFVLELDTPGGIDTSMRDITQRFLDARVPVVVHVAPSGARAASAGAIITYASHVAAMAPGTSLGAATPVDLGGGDVEQKVVNDAVALAESLAEARGRDVEFAIDMVREARAAGATEAHEIGVVELLAADRTALLEALDGMEVTLADGRQVTLATEGAVVDEHEMGLFRRIQQVLADPNLAFLFMSIGTLGVIYELASPGIGVGGVVGGAMLVLALFSLAVLPVATVGFLFLLLAAALFVAELFAPGVGIFAFLGAGSLLLSGIFLFDDAPGVQVSLSVMLPTVIVMAGATIIAGRLALRARSAPSTTSGPGVLMGRTVTVRRAEGRRGEAFVDGTWWRLRADDPLEPGDEVEVVDLDGLELVARHGALSREERTADEHGAGKADGEQQTSGERTDEEGTNDG